MAQVLWEVLRPPPVALRPAIRVWQRNLAVYRKTWTMNILPNFFEPVFYLLGMGLGLGAYVVRIQDLPYLAYIAPGLVAAAAMNGASFETTYNVFVKLHFGHLYDAIITTPVNIEDVALGELLWAITRAAIYGGSFLLIVILFGAVDPLRGLLLLPLILLTGWLFAAIGLTFTGLIPSIELYSYYYTLFLTPLFLFSGIFFPVEERFPPWLLKVAWSTPLYHAVALMRGVVRGGSPAGLALHLAYLVGLALLLSVVAVNLIRRKVVR